MTPSTISINRLNLNAGQAGVFAHHDVGVALACLPIGVVSVDGGVDLPPLPGRNRPLKIESLWLTVG
jgi:hypothetical protein